MEVANYFVIFPFPFTLQLYVFPPSRLVHSPLTILNFCVFFFAYFIFRFFSFRHYISLFWFYFVFFAQSSSRFRCILDSDKESDPKNVLILFAERFSEVSVPILLSFSAWRNERWYERELTCQKIQPSWSRHDIEDEQPVAPFCSYFVVHCHWMWLNLQMRSTLTLLVSPIFSLV